MKIPPLHILIVGEPFAGKSTFCRTMPTPNLVFFFDPVGKDEAYLECGDVQDLDNGQPLKTLQGAPMKRVWSREKEPKLLFQVEYYHDGEWVEDPIKGGFKPTPVAYEQFCKRLINIDQEFDYWNTISLDSYSGAELSAMLREKFKLNPGTKFDLRHWGGGARSELEMAIFARFGMFPMNVVVICHEKVYQNDKTGEIIRQADTYGNLGNTFGRGFSEMYRMVNIPNVGRQLQTQKDAMWNANSKYAPNPCEPSYQAVIASITNQGE
ncbi:hypothetical protein LCGC14_0752360 [marine sediment metagenome]|uniref:Uncharacterized protein n=1 Tax=marine sediment metagenome TaxID=412755 RepID=A0A0F9SNR5_9ZZZZ